MSNIPKISEAEWAVMKAIWNENPITSNRVIEVVSESTNWQPKTIRTLLNRLVSKGAVGHDGKGREYKFFPLIEESVVAKAESSSSPEEKAPGWRRKRTCGPNRWWKSAASRFSGIS